MSPVEIVTRPAWQLSSRDSLHQS